MSSQIILNSSNYVESSNSFVYQFPISQKFDVDMELGLSSVNVFNSFYNVSSTMQNNKVIIDFPSAESDYVTVEYTIADGFYDTSSFNFLLQKIMYDNFLYTVPSSDKVTYYLNLAVSDAQYANTLTTYSIPLATAPPTGATWLTNTGTQRSPRVYFGKGLGNLFGFNEPSTDYTTSYGSSNLTSYSVNSNITPQINPSQSIVFTCSVVKNTGLAFPSNFLYSLGINASFGSLIVNPSHEIVYNKVLQGHVSEIEIKLYDQNLNPMYLLDTNALMILSLRKKKRDRL
jgi:hypothetical protein